MSKQVRDCPHCYAVAIPAYCGSCNREMCEECISYGDAGKVCGLCRDREEGRKRWEASGSLMEFEEWYDKNG
jgi:hypothetical protein